MPAIDHEKLRKYKDEFDWMIPRLLAMFAI